LKSRAFLALFSLLVSSFCIGLQNPNAQAALPTGISCTSGDAVDTGTGNVHIITFTAGSDSVDGNCTFTVPENVYAADYLIVGGGGGGASGGGGAGGLVTSWAVRNQADSADLAPRGSPLALYPGSNVQIRVGVGGASGGGGATWDYANPNGGVLPARNGNTSQFGSVIAPGGGAGGFGYGCQGGSAGTSCVHDGITYNLGGSSGGSGGGSSYDFIGSSGGASTGSSVAGATSRGSAGGQTGGSGGYRAGAGGGGAGSSGGGAQSSGDGLQHIGGVGGSGVRVNISGTSYLYACGGGGGLNENDGPRTARYGPFTNGNASFENMSERGIYGDYGYEYSDDGVTYWYYDSEADVFYSPMETVYSHVAGTDIFEFVDEFDVVNTITATYWAFDYENSSWTNQTTGEVWQRPNLGGGLGGCTDAGHGSNVRVHPASSDSEDSDATSGLNNFGHGGGGTDPESTVAGRGGNGVVVIRYITEDPNCPNDGTQSPNNLPIACIAQLKITAGDTANSSRTRRSVDVLNNPISYSTSGDTISFVTSVGGLDVSIWDNKILASVTSSTSPLIGGTYPIMYRITSGSSTSDSFVLITVRDPSQHTQTRVPVDPRNVSVILPKIILGQVDAVQVCVSPKSSSDYPVLPKVELVRNPGDATVDSVNGKNLRMVGSSSSINANLELIRLTSEQQRLIRNGKSIQLDINVSNTAVGGNGSCEFGTDSVMTVFPLKLTQVRSFTVLPKNGRQNN